MPAASHNTHPVPHTPVSATSIVALPIVKIRFGISRAVDGAAEFSRQVRMSVSGGVTHFNSCRGDICGHVVGLNVCVMIR